MAKFLSLERMNRPKLSIVLPVYGVDRFLNKCLDSIKSQSFTDWEAILVDDGSRDFSGLICDSYARSDPRFRVIHQDNAGVSVARNVGIEASTAPYLSFIDPDDFISENFYADILEAMERAGADLSKSETVYVEEDGTEGRYSLINRIEKEGSASYSRVMPDNQAVVEAQAGNLFSCVAWGKVYRRELWECARFPAGVDLGEDMMTVPALIAKAQSAVFVPEAVYYWRQRKRSLLHGSVTKERLAMDFQASAIMLDDLISLHPEMERAWRKLTFLYDFGCTAAYLESTERKGTN